VILSKRPQTDRKEDTTVAVAKSMGLVAATREQLATASPDVLRELLEAFVNVLMSAEADAVCGAPYGEVPPERVNRRNGYRDRPFDTRVGSIELRIPKLRSGSYFPDWLLERRKRAETALTTVVATCYLLGVSTRRLERLAEGSSHQRPVNEGGQCHAAALCGCLPWCPLS
jgi:putative transposase